MREKQAIDLIHWVCDLMGIEDDHEQRISLAADKIQRSGLDEEFVKQAFQNAIEGNLDIKPQELRPFRISALYIMNVISSQRRHDINKRAQIRGNNLPVDDEVELSEAEKDERMEIGLKEWREKYTEVRGTMTGTHQIYDYLDRKERVAFDVSSKVGAYQAATAIVKAEIEQERAEEDSEYKKMSINFDAHKDKDRIKMRAKEILLARYFEEELTKQRS